MKSVSAAAIAEVLGISKSRVGALAVDGVLPRAGHGLFDIPACVQAFIRHKVETAKGDSSVVDLTSQRYRLARLKADAAEREAKLVTGEYVEASEIEAAWLEVASAVRSRILLIPNKVAARVIALKTPAEAQALLRREIDAALTAIAATPAI